MRILITGANGQVGNELLRAFADMRAGQHESRPPHRASRAFAFAPPFLRKGEEQHPLPPEEGRQARFLRSDKDRAASADAHPLPQEGGRHEVAGGCRPPHDIIPATRNGTLEDGTPCEAIDLADSDGLAKALDRIAPDIIINAAAYTAVDRAEDEPELAQRINGDAVGVLGAWAKQHGARVVHYSTDYVFDGSATRPYRETDATHPVSVYGRTKLAGEIALRDSGARHLIFRTAWVYASRGQNFLRTMLRLGAEGDELRVVDDQIGAPTPARLIAEVTAQVIAQWSNDDTPARDGVYHLVASGQTSWCGFARAIFEKAIPFRASQAQGEANDTPFGTKGVDAQHRGDARGPRNGMLLREPRVVAITTADYPTRAERPAFSVLDTAKLHDAFGIVAPHWRVALDGVVGELVGG